jgi:hypothetical protein
LLCREGGVCCPAILFSVRTVVWEVLEIALLPKDDDDFMNLSEDSYSNYNLYENKI